MFLFICVSVRGSFLKNMKETVTDDCFWEEGVFKGIWRAFFKFFYFTDSCFWDEGVFRGIWRGFCVLFFFFFGRATWFTGS